jgi:galactose mutarotase-like enzyme
MAKGGVSTNTGEDAVYSVDEAVGWDECFPTVSRWDAAGTAWNRKLRDHGDLWGRPWQIESQTRTSLHTVFAGTGFRFNRTLSLEGRKVTANYAVDTTSATPLPFLWALHSLLATLPGEEIRLPGTNRLVVTFLSLDGRRIETTELAWPGAANVLPFPIDHVQSIDSRFMGKFFAPHQASASVGGVNGWLDMEWEGIEHLGIWIAYGAWPTPGAIHHLALEPTSDPLDHLGQVLDRGTTPAIPPGTTRSWRVSMTLRGPAATA